MPELPEVETTRRGIAAHITGQRVTGVIVRERRLRWPVPKTLASRLKGQTVTDVRRRAKYLLLDTGAGSAILHLGMSGSLRLLDPATPLRTHDHVDIGFDTGRTLRFNDPRRFGTLLWTRQDPLRHRLLAGLGPEPLEDDFDGAYLYRRSRKRRIAIKQFLMDGKVVVGVGNIYANEALHAAGIHPLRQAGRTGPERYARLAAHVKEILANAIEVGGTTLRDFLRPEGSPGYFQLELAVYGRAGQPCPRCGDAIRQVVTGQRSTFYCSSCQT